MQSGNFLFHLWNVSARTLLIWQDEVGMTASETSGMTAEKKLKNKTHSIWTRVATTHPVCDGQIFLKRSERNITRDYGGRTFVKHRGDANMTGWRRGSFLFGEAGLIKHFKISLTSNRGQESASQADRSGAFK